MMLLDAGARALDYSPCRYGASKAVFRGPERDLSQPYLAVLGGSQTFGKYVAEPYPVLVERALGQPVANLAALNAGPDFYLSDPATLEVAARAKVVVLQITGAEALSNPLYSVHNRRNDRFVAARPALRALFPQVDFTEIHFTRHLMQVLSRADCDRFALVVQVLRQTWLTKTRQLLAQMPAQRLLLWLDDDAARAKAATTDRGPLFIDRGLIEALRPDVTAIIRTAASPRARALAPFDMTYPETEAIQAACLPGAAVHAEVAECLVPVLRGLV